ncbi:MAG: helix-turn-helix transcriptional regulator [Eubacterium sp.]|nr:helix-turn-helix transcriptional regulator [Eubacterium sp.]
MTISEKIFQLLEERGMSQKEFSERTGIAQSSISDWKRKKTNPVAEKILIICEQLDVTPYELLSGTDGEGTRSNPSDVMIIRKDSEVGRLVVDFMEVDNGLQGRLIGYMRALKELQKNSGVKEYV